jgi:hypothetical protein
MIKIRVVKRTVIGVRGKHRCNVLIARQNWQQESGG